MRTKRCSAARPAERKRGADAHAKVATAGEIVRQRGEVVGRRHRHRSDADQERRERCPREAPNPEETAERLALVRAHSLYFFLLTYPERKG